MYVRNLSRQLNELLNDILLLSAFINMRVLLCFNHSLLVFVRFSTLKASLIALRATGWDERIKIQNPCQLYEVVLYNVYLRWKVFPIVLFIFLAALGPVLG